MWIAVRCHAENGCGISKHGAYVVWSLAALAASAVKWAVRPLNPCIAGRSSSFSDLDGAGARKQGGVALRSCEHSSLT